MVERQPEKLKVVGSNPIPDKMLFLLYFVVFLALNNFNSFGFNITPSLFILLNLFLVFFLKHTTTNVSFIGLKYFYVNIYLQLNLFGSFLKNFFTKYVLTVQFSLLK